MIKELKSKDMDCGCRMLVNAEATAALPQVEYLMCPAHDAGPELLAALDNISWENRLYSSAPGQPGEVMKRNYDLANEAILAVKTVHVPGEVDQRVQVLEDRMQGIEAGIDDLTDSLQELLGERQLALDSKEAELRQKVEALANKEAELAAKEHGGCIQVIPKKGFLPDEADPEAGP